MPPAYASTAGNLTFLGPLSNAQRTYQLLIHQDQLTGLVGQQISAISWRLPASATGPWPAADVTFTDYDIYLSGSVTPSARSLTDFSANVVPPQTQVRSGSLTIPTNAYPSGASPNDFGPEITFTSPWLYTGGQSAGGNSPSRFYRYLSKHGCDWNRGQRIWHAVQRLLGE